MPLPLYARLACHYGVFGCLKCCGNVPSTALAAHRVVFINVSLHNPLAPDPTALNCPSLSTGSPSTWCAAAAAACRRQLGWTWHFGRSAAAGGGVPQKKHVQRLARQAGAGTGAAAGRSGAFHRRARGLDIRAQRGRSVTVICGNPGRPRPARAGRAARQRPGARGCRGHRPHVVGCGPAPGRAARHGACILRSSTAHVIPAVRGTHAVQGRRLRAGVSHCCLLALIAEP